MRQMERLLETRTVMDPVLIFSASSPIRFSRKDIMEIRLTSAPHHVCVLCPSWKILLRDGRLQYSFCFPSSKFKTAWCNGDGMNKQYPHICYSGFFASSTVAVMRDQGLMIMCAVCRLSCGVDINGQD